MISLIIIFAGGAWLVAHAAEQRRRFKAVLCTKPARTFSQIRGERIKAERSRNNTVLPMQVDSSDWEDDKALDGFFLVQSQNIFHHVIIMEF